MSLVFGLALSAHAQTQPGELVDSWLSAIELPWSQPQKPHPSVARIIVPERDGVAFGSGTLVDVNDEHGLVVTNWHVVEGAAREITVVFPDGFRSAAEVLKLDRDWDLAALRILKPRSTGIARTAGTTTRRDVDDRRLWFRILSCGHRPLHPVRWAGAELPVRDGRAVGHGASGRFWRPDLQQPRSTGRCIVRRRPRSHVRKLLWTGAPLSDLDLKIPTDATRHNRSGSPDPDNATASLSSRARPAPSA